MIDGQIGEYDIFIGLLWTRFGTPTSDAGSGTEHEFERAYERFRMYPDKLRIMIYFKDAPVTPTDIDPIQLAKVNEFKKRISNLGAYYWPFKSGDQFGNLVRVHLTRQVQEFRTSWGTEAASASIPIPVASPSAQAIAAETVEIGFLDLLETALDSFNQLPLG